MYFPDLSPYQYGNTDPIADIVNVGWLSETHAFPTGPADDRLIEALHTLVASPVNLYRGHHHCEFCPKPALKEDANGLRLVDAAPGTFGTGEIRVVATSGITYVAPVLILHYVVAHGYAPPPEFVGPAIAAAARAAD
jgi:hypothetical protein